MVKQKSSIEETNHLDKIIFIFKDKIDYINEIANNY